MTVGHPNALGHILDFNVYLGVLFSAPSDARIEAPRDT